MSLVGLQRLQRVRLRLRCLTQEWARLERRLEQQQVQRILEQPAVEHLPNSTGILLEFPGHSDEAMRRVFLAYSPGGNELAYVVRKHGTVVCQLCSTKVCKPRGMGIAALQSCWCHDLSWSFFVCAEVPTRQGWGAPLPCRHEWCRGQHAHHYHARPGSNGQGLGGRHG